VDEDIKKIGSQSSRLTSSLQEFCIHKKGSHVRKGENKGLKYGRTHEEVSRNCRHRSQDLGGGRGIEGLNPVRSRWLGKKTGL